MAKEWAKAFYNSNKWIKCRNAYIGERIAIDGGMCEECKQYTGCIVHHKVVLNESNINNPDITLNPSKLEYVCQRCHNEFEGHGIGFKRKKLKSLFKFDDAGQPISLRPIDKKNEYPPL